MKLDAPLDSFAYLLHWLGAPFRMPRIPWAATGIASLFLLLLLYSLVFFIRRLVRGEENAMLRPWLVLALYSLITGSGIAAGRLGFSPESAFAPRYFLHQVLLPIALLPLALLEYQNLSPTRMRRRLKPYLFLCTTGLLVIFCTVSVIRQWTEADATARATALKRARGAVALSFINAIPVNPDLSLLNPNIDSMISQARLFRNCGILDLTLHKPLPVGADRPAEQRIDGLQLTLRVEGSILAIGRCPVSRPGGEISHLLLTSIHGGRNEKAFAVITPELTNDPRQVETIAGMAIQFRTHVHALCLEQGLHLLKAWIYDAPSGEYIPLAGGWIFYRDETGIFIFPATDPIVPRLFGLMNMLPVLIVTS